MQKSVKMAKNCGVKLLRLQRRPANPMQGLLQAGSITFPAALGRGGISAFKREGDGATPRGRHRLVHGFYRGARPPAALTLARLTRRMVWCDAPAHPAYNRLSRLPLPVSHERLWRDDRLYDVCIVMDWNMRQRKRGCGSAIFFHLARPGFLPTEGCVALSARDMRRLLPFIGPDTVLIV
ncbi:L,D-transpeptidase family protein [Allorhizobium undicola]|uniref:L,D-transpeptidase family protein n=1 Tax=Allorhizobium undicola TaxID=78527 RepID=UPI000687ABB6|nr:L,D-transpeptidase family protein [Allorhizobium undicola]